MLTPFDSPKSLHWQQSLRAPIVRQLEIFSFTTQFLTFLIWDRLTGANRGKKRQRRAKWLVDRLMNLGPTFIKIGQSLSTRADLSAFGKLSIKLKALSCKVFTIIQPTLYKGSIPYNPRPLHNTNRRANHDRCL